MSRVAPAAHPLDVPDPLVYGLFLRALGVVYLVAFASLASDVVPIAGRHGISPLAPQLDAIRRDFPGPRRFLRWPTLFWIDASDRALRVACALGIALSLCAIAGLASPLAFALLFVLYLSFALPLDFFYPWDAALLEAGALAVCMPALAPLPELAAVAAPLPPIAWAYRWLLFRIVFGFGKYKFFGPGRLHVDYLRSFLVSQPLSTPLALLASRHLPKVAFTVALALLFVVEVPTPFLVFGPPPARLFALAAIALLMVAIQLGGNFGFFNLIVLVLCLPLLDLDGAVWDARLLDLLWPLDHLARTTFALALFVGGLVSLPFNSWIAQAWPYWASFDRRRGLRAIARVARLVAPLRLVHAFGVFSPESGPPMKWVPVVEGTRDGETWRVYPYRFMPSSEESPGRFVAPFMPRFDHALIYDALGISLSNLMGSVFAVQNPYRYGRHGWMERLGQRLIEGRPEVLRLFARDPFEGAPPIAVRVRLKTFELDGAGGWKVRDVGTHLPAQRPDPSVARSPLPPPELFHWDDRATRRLSTPWRARMAAPEDPAALERLERVVIPAVQAFDPRRPGALDVVQERLAAIPEDERADLEALVARVAWRLATAFEATGAKETWFDLGLMAHDAILRGRAFVDAALADPADALDALRPVTFWRGVRLWAAFRPEMLRFGARKARVRELTLRGAARAPHPLAPGFLAHLPALARLFPDPTEALVPYRRTSDGWVRGGAPPCVPISS